MFTFALSASVSSPVTGFCRILLYILFTVVALSAALPCQRIVPSNKMLLVFQSEHASLFSRHSLLSDVSDLVFFSLQLL